MTDSNKPNRPPRRKDGSREPPTIDLKATIIDAPATGPETAQDVGPQAELGTSDRAAVEPMPGAEAAASAPEDRIAGDPAASEALSREAASATADEPVTGPVPPEPPAREARGSTGFGSLLGASLLGGVVGAGAVWAVQTWQAPAPPPVSAPSSTTPADPRVAQLQQQVGALAPKEALQALEGRLTALEATQQSFTQRVEAAQQLAERGAARAEEALSRPLPAPPAPAPAAADNSQAIADLQSRLTALDDRLEERAQAASGSIETLQRQVSDNAQSLQGRVAQATESVQRQLSEQEQRLTALASQVAEGGSEATRAGIRVVLADRLTSTLSEGAPYAEVLTALKDFGLHQDRLAALDPFAGSGAPTPAALAESFRPLGDRIIRESRAGDSWSDRLLRMADKVVTVRSVDEPGSTDPSSVVARIESALANGNLAVAANAWNSLPEPARRLSEAWGRQLKQREAAEAAARAIAADAVAALNTATR